MTTERKKQIERAHLEKFRRTRPDWAAVLDGEKPDFRVQRVSGREIGIEVVEYHPHDNARVAMEARWWKELLPRLEHEQATRPDLQHLRVRLWFDGKSRVADSIRLLLVN